MHGSHTDLVGNPRSSRVRDVGAGLVFGFVHVPEDLLLIKYDNCHEAFFDNYRIDSKNVDKPQIDHASDRHGPTPSDADKTGQVARFSVAGSHRLRARAAHCLSRPVGGGLRRWA